MEKLIPQLEALLFIYGEPMAYKKIADVLKVKEKDVEEAAAALAKELENDGRGLSLIAHGGRAQLVTKGEFKNIAEAIIKEELQEALTPAALETLSIIAYAAPVSRAELEYIRGVNSSFILRSLLLRGLIERTQDPKRANAYVYNPSFDLLKHLGITGVQNLPEFEKFQALMKKIRVPENEESQPTA